MKTVPRSPTYGQIRSTAVACAALIGLLASSCETARAEELRRKPLSIGTAARLESVAELRISPNGERFAATYRSYGSSGDEISMIRLHEVESGATAQFIERADSTGTETMIPRWSPAGDRLAYVRTEGGDYTLWVYDLSSDRHHEIVPAIASGWASVRHPPTWAPAWAPDGGALAFLGPCSSSQEAAAGAAMQTAVRVLRTEGSPAVQRRNMHYAFTRSQLEIYRFGGSREVISRDCGVSRFAFSPDGRRLAYLVFRGGAPIGGEHLFDIHVYDRGPRTSQRIGTDAPIHAGDTLVWSPDGAYIAYATRSIYAETRASEEIWIVDVQSGRQRRLSDAHRAAFTHVGKSPVWLRDGRALLDIDAQGRLWHMRLEGRSRTLGPPDVQFKRIVFVDDARAVVVCAQRGSSGTTLSTVSLSDGSVRHLFSDPGRLQSDPSVSRAPRYALFSLERHDDPGGIHILDPTSGETRRILHVAPGVNRLSLGTSRMIEWKALDGTPVRGALLLPPGGISRGRLPLVVWVYGGFRGSERAEAFGLWDRRTFNMQILATRGFAVLFPDTVARVGSPAEDIHRSVMRAVEAVIAAGFADPQRIAIMGHSYGSFSTLSVITRTNRFKAAIISAVGESNLFAAYVGGMTPDGHGGNIATFEAGQKRMGGSPWEYPDRYTENSSFFRLDQVTTPLLMIHGAEDTLPTSGPDGLFVALRRLGKPVEYRLYADEGHTLARPENIVDFWNAAISFLAKNLRLRFDSYGMLESP